MGRRTGFTLVEILIVVIILGILAAIVIPQFTEASNDARESALASDLQTLRSQIELYKVQHLEALPGDGTASFLLALTGRTDVDGAVDAAGVYGPYLQKFPTNPFTNTDTVEIEAGSAGVGGSVSGGTGWHFDTTTGQIHADDDAHMAL